MPRLIGPVVLILAFGGAGLAQINHPINGGFGNPAYPGTGHPATVNPITLNPSGYALQRSIGFAGRGRGPGIIAPVPNHPYHGNAAIVPYPIFYGYFGDPGYYGTGYNGYYGPAYGADTGVSAGYPNQAPSVVINQTFLPAGAVPPVINAPSAPDQNAPEVQPQPQSGMQLHEGLKTPQYSPQAAGPADEPTLYLIALKDHSIIPALGYWVQGGNLFYVSTEHAINELSLDLVDRDLSQRLNTERNLDFRLPKAQ